MMPPGGPRHISRKVTPKYLEGILQRHLTLERSTVSCLGASRLALRAVTQPLGFSLHVPSSVRQVVPHK